MYAWGANSYGQLCNGNTEDQISPYLVPGIKPVSIAAGGGHTFYISDDTLFCCGSNSSGQLGIDNAETQGKRVTDKCVTQPAKVPGVDFASISSVACGWDFSFILYRNGDVLAFGSNVYGQLGLPACKTVPRPTKIELSMKVSSIACGLRHTILLMENGTVYCTGAATKGQVGINASDVKKISQFTKVDTGASVKVVQVIAGAYNSAARTESGAVLVWGDNKHGQLAQNPSDSPRVHTATCIPAQAFNYRPVVSLVSGWTHMLAQTDDGAVYSWGRNDYFQLGRHTNGNSPHHVPGLVSFPVPPSKMAAGSEHNLALVDGVVYSWGWNEHGICGTGDEKNVSKPQPVPYFNASYDFDSKNLSTICNTEHATEPKNSSHQIGSVPDTNASNEENITTNYQDKRGTTENLNSSENNAQNQEMRKQYSESNRSKCTYIACGAGHSFAVFS